MRIEWLPIRGAAVLVGETVIDARGSFSKLATLPELAELGLETSIVQLATATNVAAGTVRGLHYQAPPHEESKYVWCLTGSILDVLVDVRPDEPTFGTWIGVELSADEDRAVYVPPGVAHGYQTLTADARLMYAITAGFQPQSARRLKWDDPALAIDWPMPTTVISDADAEAPTWPPAP